ncbi:Protein saal1 [Sparganum proliferum]
MATRNPSPPRDASGSSTPPVADNIGETAYSKMWLYSLILRVLKFLQAEPGDPDTILSDSIDSELEKELCCLWDITVNREVLPHLREFRLVPVFSGAVARVLCPRLTEISLGILANLALDESECTQMTEEPAFITNILNLMGSTDTRILMELFRLLQAALASHSNRQAWLDAIHFTPEFFDRATFILCSSTNAGLLVNTISAVETIVRVDDSISEVWCNDQLLSAILEAQKQMHWLHGDEVEVIHRLLYIFSSNRTGVQTLMSKYYDLYPGFGVYLRKVCEDEPHLIPFERYHNSLRAIIPVIDVIVSNLPLMSALTTFDSDPDILPCLFNIAWGCAQQEHLATCSVSLTGLWEDLAVMFGDLMRRVQDLLQEKMPTDGAIGTPPASVSRTLRWLFCLEKSTTPGLRDAFVRCCLSRRGEVRGHLVYACHQLHLENLLELVTDEN